MLEPLKVVLVRPETPENIGFIARCMRGYGLSDLRLVGVEAPHPEGYASKAYWTAHSSESILRSSQSFATLPQALSDCQQAIGFSRRERDSSQIHFDLQMVQAHFEGRLSPSISHFTVLPQPGLNTALVFGCESKGLSPSDVLHLTHLVGIPMPDSEMSLNLSHAVAIALYALATSTKEPPSQNLKALRPTLEESMHALDLVMEELNRSGFLTKGKKEAIQREKVRILWQRLQPTRGELDFICGALKSLPEKAER